MVRTVNTLMQLAGQSRGSRIARRANGGAVQAKRERVQCVSAARGKCTYVLRAQMLRQGGSASSSQLVVPGWRCRCDPRAVDDGCQAHAGRDVETG